MKIDQNNSKESWSEPKIFTLDIRQTMNGTLEEESEDWQGIDVTSGD